MNTKKNSWLRLVASLALAVVIFFQSAIISKPAMAATAQDLLSEATGNFVESIVSGYQKEAQSSFDKGLKEVKTTVDDLANLLDKVAKNPNSVNRNQIADTIEESQKKLNDLAQNFNVLADKTEDFDQNLEKSVADLLALVKGKVRNNFNDSEKAFKDVANAVTKISEDSARVNDKNFLDIANDVTKDFKNLNQAAEIVSKTIKAFNS